MSEDIFRAKTEHVGPLKLLIEVLREVVMEVPIEIRSGDVKKKTKKITDTEDEEKTVVSKKDKKKNKKEEIMEDEEELDEDMTDGGEREDGDTGKKSEKGGIKIITLDQFKKLLIYVKLDAEQFSFFKSKKRSFNMGVSLVNLYKLIKSLEKDDILSLYVPEDDKQHLVLEVDNEQKDYNTKYRLKLMDIDKINYDIPKITFEAVITMDATEFHKICREMSGIAEYLEIKCTPNNIIFTCKGDFAERSTRYNTGDNGVKIKFPKTSGKKETGPQIIQGIYELSYLVMFNKCGSMCNDIQIFMRNDYPICIKYAVATLGNILICLSPHQAEQAGSNFSDDDELYSDDEEKVVIKKQ